MSTDDKFIDLEFECNNIKSANRSFYVQNYICKTEYMIFLVHAPSINRDTILKCYLLKVESYNRTLNESHSWSFRKHIKCKYVLTFNNKNKNKTITPVTGL